VLLSSLKKFIIHLIRMAGFEAVVSTCGLWLVSQLQGKEIHR